MSEADGDEKNYELWESRFLGHLRKLGLKDTVLKEPRPPPTGADEAPSVEDDV